MSATDKLNGEIRVCQIPYLSGRPWIDGKLDDKAWKQAVCFEEMLDITGHLEHRYNIAVGNPLSFQPPPPLRPADPCPRVFMGHDGTYLYLGFICNDPNIKELRKRDHAFSSNVDQEDCIYIWLDPDLTHMTAHSFEYIINAAGQKSENVRGKFSGDYDSLMAWEGRVSIEQDRWMAEVMIPLDRLGLNPTDKNAFGLNVGRGYRGKWQTHALFKPDEDFPPGWGFGVLLDSENSPGNGIGIIDEFLAYYQRRQNGRMLSSEPGTGSRDQNAMIGISAWGPDHQPTVSIGRSDSYDRRWFGNEEPVVTRPEVIEAARSGNPGAIQALRQRRCGMQYTAYQHFPAPKPVGQTIFFLPGGASSGWVTDISQGKDGATVLDCRCSRGSITLLVYVHKKRNLVVVEGKQAGLDNEEIMVRLYRHNDSPKPREIPGYDYKADAQAGKNVGPLPPPEVGKSDQLMWLRQRFFADPTFPNGFEVLMGCYLPAAEIVCAEIQENDTGLGTPAKSPNEGWVDPVSRQTWKATDYQRSNLLPGSAVSNRIVLKKSRFRAFFPVVSTNDGVDTITVAEKTCEYAGRRAPEELEADSNAATSAEMIGDYKFQQDLALSSIFSAKFCFSDVTSWHGDFHFNEWSEVFYDYFIEGRTDELESYFQMVEANLPAARLFAKEMFGCGGAAWSVASFPMRLERLPLTNLDWDYSLECTGLVFQPFWLTYLYTMDRTFLEQRAYPALREAARFYADYVTKEDDGLYHVWPCTSSEHVTLQPHLKYNRDSNAALSMVKFILNAAIEGAKTLDLDPRPANSWQHILDHLAAYPTEDNPDGARFVDVAGARLMTEYNIIAPLFAVFYGNDIGLASPAQDVSTAKRTLDGVRRLSTPQHWPHVYRAMVRLGMYPGGELGCENLIQSHQGPIFLFPAVPGKYTGAFERYHARGGFVISARMERGVVQHVEIHAQAGGICRIAGSTIPAAGGVECREDGQNIASALEGERYLRFHTDPGKHYVVLFQRHPA